ncbi:stress response protein nst1-like [Astyanax mexicanus]|uniref:Coiled-coil domain containing 166 n=1 Tax=Astyanax mexicanus TaxID=7994 RepID=A0A8B9RK58_ASTMX|nr:stress response protein nst1-like [Astyanax mexicanus]
MAERREEQLQESSGAYGHLQTEYNSLTGTLNTMKRRAAQLRKDNEFLHNEIYKTRMETQEYVSCMFKQTQDRQSAIDTLKDQTQKKLEDLRRQREEALEKYQEQTTELKREILKKEHELALLKTEIAELKEFESVRQQQLGRIADLEQEKAAMHQHHAESLAALKASFLKEKEQYEAQVKDKMQAFTQAADKEATRCLHSRTEDVFQENQLLRKELQQLSSRACALQNKKLSMTCRRDPQQQKENMQKLNHVSSSTNSLSTTLEGASAVRTDAGADPTD